MISRRTIGVRTITLFWQLIAVTLAFWAWLFIWQTAVFGDSNALQHYLLYNEFLLIGVIFGLRGSSHRDAGRKEHEFVSANRQTLRQAFLALFAVFVIEFIMRDRVVSR